MSEMHDVSAFDVMAQQLVIAFKTLQVIRDNVNAETDWRDIEAMAGGAIDAMFVLGVVPVDLAPGMVPEEIRQFL